MKKTKLSNYDVATSLDSPAEVAEYLRAAFEDGDARVVAHALGNVARARGMSEIAKATGLGRESLYKALSPEGNPTLATVLKVIEALGLRLTPRPLRR